ncbi:CDF family Co(II)/Ni(II) efflux transporter DmeF [Sphingosinicella sp. BN140058]|uniref:CDF family Co(II)/Ni(II) efflux transporter DmeF n=1 Tax=Sphingosinicella sp. BN140058 TaxID=1892855 RepID=UPI0013E9D730|nr:CDF family Co(II)/Ni(II) efflux transporter DmeF [Sphingosinicella sp. BN140058]
MHNHLPDADLAHSHRFGQEDTRRSERRTLLVVGLTVVMMLAEIIGGALTGSMALLADGWHMGSHAAAIGLAAFAYRFARRHAHDRRFSFGTGKVGPLAGFASAIVLGLIALAMAYESAQRLLTPLRIEYSEAMIVAAIGLIVNLASAALLGGDHHHHDSGEVGEEDHDHHDYGEPGHHHHDHNLRAAYVHVLADAMTSLLAILALAGGSWLGLFWLDPVIGIVGAGVILWWSWGLIRGSGRVLLDVEASQRTADRIRAKLEADADNRIIDLHLWQVGTGHLALIVSVLTHHPRPPAHYKALLRNIDHLAHVTIEVVPCEVREVAVHG